MNRAMAAMTGPEYLRCAADAKGIIVPLASLEILGAHGPLGADISVAERITPMIAEDTSCIYAPTVPYGDTLELKGWEGTVHIPSRTLEAYIEAVARSLVITKKTLPIILIAYHSLNIKAADMVCRTLTSEGQTVLLADWWRAAGQVGAHLIEDKENGFGHGGELISSVLLAIGAIRQSDICSSGEMPRDSLARVLKYQMSRGDAFQQYGTFKEYCDSGAWGALAGASKEKGEKIIELAVTALSNFISTALS